MDETTVHAHVRIEKDGQYAEYNDHIGIASLDGRAPTDRQIVDYVMGLLINHSPQMKGGRVTRSRIRRR